MHGARYSKIRHNFHCHNSAWNIIVETDRLIMLTRDISQREANNVSTFPLYRLTTLHCHRSFSMYNLASVRLWLSRYGTCFAIINNKIQCLTLTSSLWLSVRQCWNANGDRVVKPSFPLLLRIIVDESIACFSKINIRTEETPQTIVELTWKIFELRSSECSAEKNQNLRKYLCDSNNRFVDINRLALLRYWWKLYVKSEMFDQI